jgi:hypothetical protein
MELEHDIGNIKFCKFYMNYLQCHVINKVWMKIIYAWMYCNICIVNKLWTLMRDAESENECVCVTPNQII